MSDLRSQTDAAAVRDALAVLGVPWTADAAALKAAFHQAVKAARPDRDGGDPDRFRQIIAAYRLIQAHGRPRPGAVVPTLAPCAPGAAPRPAPVLILTPIQAIDGARVMVRIGARRLAVSAPPGMRTGDRVRLRQAGPAGADLHMPVLIRPADGLSALGDDLFMTHAAGWRVLREGGRVEIPTYAGVRSAWVMPDRAAGLACIRLKGLGLPAQGSRAAGHLFVTLTGCQDAPSPAQDLLVRFTRVWTPQRLAA